MAPHSSTLAWKIPWTEGPGGLQSTESQRAGHFKSLSRVRLFVTPLTVAYQAPLSMGFSRQEYWSGLPFPSPGDLPDSEIEPTSPVLAGRFFTAEPLGKPLGTVLEHKGV